MGKDKLLMVMSAPPGGGLEFAPLGGLLREVVGLPACPRPVVSVVEEYAGLVAVYRQRFRRVGAPDIDQVAQWRRLSDRHTARDGRCQRCGDSCRRGDAVRSARAALEALMLGGRSTSRTADSVGAR